MTTLDYGAFPPATILRMTKHIAMKRWHTCSECFAPISIHERYWCTVYKDNDSGRIAQYKTHDCCPYSDQWS